MDVGIFSSSRYLAIVRRASINPSSANADDLRIAQRLPRVIILDNLRSAA